MPRRRVRRGILTTPAPEKWWSGRASVESEFDFCARRAAEEFMAAGRAATVAERATHRLLAEKYAEVVRHIMLQRRAAEEAERNAEAA